MKKRRMLSKTLAVVMSAAIVMSGTGISVLAQTADNAVSSNDAPVISEEVSDEIVEAENTGLTEGESATEEASVTADSEAAGSAEDSDTAEDARTDDEEISQEAGQTANEDEELTAERKEVSPTQLESMVSEDVIPDAKLREALLNIYNSEKGSSISAANFTYNRLKEIKRVVLTEANITVTKVDPAEIKSIVGLGYANGMTELDISEVGALNGKDDPYSIPGEEFAGEEKLAKVVMSDKVTRIGSLAFSNCTALKTIHVVKDGIESTENTLPSSLTDYGEGTDTATSNVFSGCEALESIVLPNLKNAAGLTRYIAMFQKCTSLTSIRISSNVSVLPNSFFKNIAGNSKVQVTVDEGSLLASIGDGCFRYSNVAHIDLSSCSRLIKIESNAFNADESDVKEAHKCAYPLESIKLPAALESGQNLTIGHRAFFRSNVSRLYTEDDVSAGLGDEDKLVSLPVYVTSVGEAAFYQDEAMEKLKLSPSLSEVSLSCFDGCSSLNEVGFSTEDVPQIAVIWDAAFRGTKISDGSFVGKMKKLTTLGKHASEAGKVALKEIGRKDNEIKKIESDYTVTYDYLEQKTGSNPVRSEVFSGPSLTTISFPASLRTIESFALWNLQGLKEAKWLSGASAETEAAYIIGDGAFALDMALEEMVLPKTDDDDKRTSIVIGNSAFDFCTSLEKVCRSGDDFSEIKDSYLPKAVISIGMSAFSNGYSLESMMISDSSYDDGEGGAYPKLNARAFEFCYKLSKTSLPDNAEIIPKGFYYDDALTELPGNPDVIRIIEAGAFFGNRMRKVDFSGFSKLESIGDLAFAHYENATNDQSDYFSDEYYALTDELYIEDPSKVTGRVLAPGIIKYKEENPDTHIEEEKTKKVYYVLNPSVEEVDAVKTPESAMTEEFIFPDVPGCEQGYIEFGRGLFEANLRLRTISTPDYHEDNVVYMPRWMNPKRCSGDLFCETGVSRVKWIYAQEGQDAPDEDELWDKINEGMFYMCHNITDPRDCLPEGEYLGKVKSLGDNSFGFCLGLKRVDLSSGDSGFGELENVGKGVFANCCNVTEIYLPDNGKCTTVSDEMFHVGLNSKLVSIGGALYSSLEKIDFGTVEKIGRNAFSTYNINGRDDRTAYDKKDLIWPSALESLELYSWEDKVDVEDEDHKQYRVDDDEIGYRVREIGDSAFRGRGAGDEALEEALFSFLDLNKFKRLNSVTWSVENEYTDDETGEFVLRYEGALTDIVRCAFQDCNKLDLTFTPMPDSLQKIGDEAFIKCSSLGKVTMGSGLGSIGSRAFFKAADIRKTEDNKEFMVAESGKGLWNVDFSRAVNLRSIGTSAFEQTAIRSFDISNTQTANLESGTLKSCPFLTKVILDKYLKQMKGDSACGCPSLQTVEIWATSTLNKGAFKSNGVFGKDGSAENGKTPLDGAFTIKVLSDEVVMGIGNAMWFPFNMRVYDPTDTTSMPVRVGNTEDTDSSIVEYFKIFSPQNYYKFSEDKAENQITDPDYYEKVTVEADKIRNVNDISNIAGFKIEGIKETPEKGVKLFVVNKFKLERADGDKEVDFDAEFNVKVKDVQYYPVLYTDAELLYENPDITMKKSEDGFMIGSGETTINLDKAEAGGIQRVYYNLKNRFDTDWLPELSKLTLVVECSDKDIMEISGSGGKYAKNKDGSDNKAKYEIEAPSNAADIATIVKGKMVNLTPKATGDVTVSFYVSEYPDNKIEWTFHIVNDEIVGKISSATITGLGGTEIPEDGELTIGVGDFITVSGNAVSESGEITEELSWKMDNNAVFKYKEGSASTPMITLEAKAAGDVRIGYGGADPDTRAYIVVHVVEMQKSLSFKNKPETIAPWETKSITAVYNGKAKGGFRWSVSDAAILKLEGTAEDADAANSQTVKITALKPKQTAKVYVESIENPDIKAEFEIAVTDSLAEKLSIDKPTAELKVGDTLTLTGTASRINESEEITEALEWSTSNSNILSFVSGKDSATATFKALSKGTVVVKYGSKLAGGKTVSCVVTVKESGGQGGSSDGDGNGGNGGGNGNGSVTPTPTGSGQGGSSGSQSGTGNVTPTPTGAGSSQTGQQVKPGDTPQVDGNTYTVLDDENVAYTSPSDTATGVTIPTTVTIGSKTFKVTEIKADAFSGNSNLKSVNIGSNVTSIGDNAFKGCKALTKIVIPKGVKKIGKNAFAGCTKLKKVTFKTTTLKKIGKGAFKTIKKGATFKCPKSKKAIYKKKLKKSGLPKKAKIK